MRGSRVPHRRLVGALKTENYLDLRLTDFVERLAADRRAPGGGSAAALAVGLAAGLVAMVARSSRESWTDAAGVAAQAQALLDRVLPLVHADAEAWEQAVVALRETGAGDAALEQKLEAAAAVPIEIADAAADAAALAELVADRGDGSYRADASVAAVLASAGARAAAHLVAVNLGVREGDVRLATVHQSAEAAEDAARRTLQSTP
jgi:formiminotetrahydrofolate cyclodeaminase